MPKIHQPHLRLLQSARAGTQPGLLQSRRQRRLAICFKAELKRRKLGPLVRANQSGCLDQCELGPTVVIYPQAIWYGHVTLEDVPRIIEETIIGGRVLDELLIRDEQLNAQKGKKSGGVRRARPRGLTIPTPIAIARLSTSRLILGTAAAPNGAWRRLRALFPCRGGCRRFAGYLILGSLRRGVYMRRRRPAPSGVSAVEHHRRPSFWLATDMVGSQPRAARLN